MPEETPGLGTVFTVLESAAVEFVLVGGLAMAAHGSDLVTQDVDICYSREMSNLVALASALAPFRPTLRGAPAELPFIFDARSLKSAFNLTLRTDLGDIDLLGAVPGVETFQGLRQRAVLLDIFGCPVRVASLDDMIAMKQAANRQKDRFHLQELYRLKKGNL